MKSQLIIKNFGPVKEADIELKPFLILIGGQGTGKSTIVKVLTICLDLLFQIRILKDEKPAIAFKEFGIYEYFQPNSYIYFHYGFIEIEYKDQQFHWVSTQCPDCNTAINILSNQLGQATKNLFPDLDAQKITNEFIRQHADLIRPNSRMALYIPAERNLAGNLSTVLASMIVARIPLSPILMEYMGLFEKAKQEFQTYTVDFLHLTFKKEGLKEAIEINNENETEQSNPLPLNHCSSGIQSMLPLLMVIDYSLKLQCFDTFTIEEPEQNLFPDNQTALLRFLIRKMHLQDFSAKSIALTTHSPYLLSALNISMLAGQLAKNKELTKEVNAILPESLHVNPDEVSAYALGNNENYCQNIINEKTKTIDQNYLDTASDILGDEFNQLYRLYLKALRK